MSTKKQIRADYLYKRNQLTQQEQHLYLAMMLEHLQQLVLPPLQYILSYIPITGRNEVLPQYFEEELQEQHPGYQLCFPRTDPENSSMVAVADAGDLVLQPNAFGVTEPVNGRLVEPAFMDLLLVPLLAFDERGYRVGYGKGFYDRYIPRCRQDVITLGLSFFEPVAEITDAGIFDVPLKYCLTPQQLYEF